MTTINFNVDAFWERLKHILKERKLTLAQLCNEIGTLPQNMKNKKFRGTYPTFSEIFLIGSYLNVPVEYLVLGKDDNPLLKRIEELESTLKQIHSMTNV